eukprot:CAMPEP_0183722800 /NCGR_PEP_ID=MMETSP0737-20130205/14650_1 /TAXON_ID=385413 /ORGANISM="Thalassiosira miniscula, Strain CCMP1093" /LENGTH=562 /DNA_ID=CAMNT_0025953037 /DNA_START=50 /DNA_END=1738 /DNA_ORIENTATION=-
MTSTDTSTANDQGKTPTLRTFTTSSLASASNLCIKSIGPIPRTLSTSSLDSAYADVELQAHQPTTRRRSSISSMGSVDDLNIIDVHRPGQRRRSSQRSVLSLSSMAAPVRHPTWHESHHLWRWKEQGEFIVWCQRAPDWIFFPPALFFHFFLKRDWGMAFGPFFAFVIYSDVRALDLFLAASSAGLFCGALKHIIRSPRPFWIVPGVCLKEGVEEMSWGTPSAHSAIQGSISAVLIYHDPANPINWVANMVLLLFCMYSRLYLAVHWPQDVLLGAVVGVASGLVVCATNIHPALIDFVKQNDKATASGLVFIVIGVGYFVTVSCLVYFLNIVSERKPVPDLAAKRYKIGVLRALRILRTEDSFAFTTAVKVKRGLQRLASLDLTRRSTKDFDCNLDEEDTLNPRTYGTMFGTLAEAEKIEEEEEHRKREQGIFFRKDIPFNPDSKVRFWYNAINVVGAYCGLGLFTCVVEKEDAEFKPTVKWIAAFYAMSFSFAVIVYTRTILRSICPRKAFKWVRLSIYWFLGFFTYGLFPLSYVAVMNASRSNSGMISQSEISQETTVFG